MKSHLFQSRVIVSDDYSHRSFQLPQGHPSLCFPISLKETPAWRVLTMPGFVLALRRKSSEVISHSVIIFSFSWCWSPTPEGQCVQVFNKKHLGEPGNFSWLSTLVTGALHVVTTLRRESQEGRFQEG